MKVPKIITLSIIALLVSSGIWALLPVDLELARKVPAFFATVSMIAMALAMLLSCRLKWLEPIFGGMDKAYVWHKWLGIAGLVGASFHWLLVPGPAGNGIDPQFADFGEEIGQWAMYGLLVLGSVSMVKQIPYRIWFYTHKLMGPIFLISVYHTFFSDVPFELFSVTGAALVIISTIGTAAYFYKCLVKPRSYKRYTVKQVTQLDNAVEVTLGADHGAIKHHAGQFAYLDFGLDNIEHFHPFTIASAPNGNELTFIIRNLGRHTQQLQTEINIGQKVTVDGAYGRLHAQRNRNKPQVWIAGGIGITPFLAWLQARDTQQPIELFYVGRGKLYQLLIAKVQPLLSSTNVTLHLPTMDNQRLDAEIIQKSLKKPLNNYQFFACGPQSMMESIKKQLFIEGMKPKQWHNENFSMR